MNNDKEVMYSAGGGLVADGMTRGGYWMLTNEGYFVCNACWDCYVIPELLMDGKWKYCPNCGARMKKWESKDDEQSNADR